MPKRNIDINEYDEKGRIIKKKREMTDLQVLKKIIGFLSQGRYRKLIYILLSIIVIGSFVGYLRPLIIQRVIDEGLGSGKIEKANIEKLFYWGKLLAITIIIGFSTWISQQYLIQYLSINVMYEMRDRLFKNLQKLGFDYYDSKDRSTGKIISYLTNDVDTIQTLISSGLLNVFGSLFSLVGALFFMFWISWRMTLVSFLLMFIIVFLGIFVLLKARKYFVIMRRKVAAVTGALQESISGMRVIKMFAVEEEDYKNFDKVTNEELLINLKAQKLFAALPGLVVSALGGGLGILLIYGAYLQSRGILQTGEIFAFALYLIQFFGPMAQIIGFINQIQNSMAAGERVVKLIEKKPTVIDRTENIILTDEGRIIFELIQNKRKTIKKYGKEKISAYLEYIENLDEKTHKLFKIIGEGPNRIIDGVNYIELAKNFEIPFSLFKEFCEKHFKNDYIYSYNLERPEIIELSKKGDILYYVLKSVRLARKKFIDEKDIDINEIIKYSLQLTKTEKKLFKLIGEKAIGIVDTTEISYLEEKLKTPKNEIIQIYERNKRYLEYKKPIELAGVKGHLEFKNVSFSYVKGIPVIKNLNMEVHPKERVAIVGYTGAGKSTLINLLARFYDVNEGAILIDGYDVRDIKIESFRKHTGLVLQENFLFSGTVMENIRYGKLDATDEEVIEAAKKVGAHEFIMNLPNGYQTEVEERGNLLSRGQKQLIAFARALIRDPPILILDEATSAVDPYSELIIQQALEILLKNRTSISIAHRLSTIINSDKIFVLDKGQIIESGSHKELLEKKGLYYQLFTLQYRDAYQEGIRGSDAPSEKTTNIKSGLI
ncbi:MAG: ABC transporter ATP-binding protein [Promethearchaeota archaeon]